MGYKFRCNCPITSALDIVGERWILVIIKQMLVEGKQTFKDFVESDESIATNILSSKLKFLEETGLITKSKLLDNKKNNIYTLTEKGLSLAPVIVELAYWGDKNLRDRHPTISDEEIMESLRKDKIAFANTLVEKYKERLSTKIY